MVESTKITNVEMEVSDSSDAEKVKADYPTAEDELVDFLNHWKLKGSKVILFPRCNFVFDKKAIGSPEKTKPQLCR